MGTTFNLAGEFFYWKESPLGWEVGIVSSSNTKEKGFCFAPSALSGSQLATFGIACIWRVVTSDISFLGGHNFSVHWYSHSYLKKATYSICVRHKGDFYFPILVSLLKFSPLCSWKWEWRVLLFGHIFATSSSFCLDQSQATAQRPVHPQHVIQSALMAFCPTSQQADAMLNVVKETIVSHGE